MGKTKEKTSKLGYGKINFSFYHDLIFENKILKIKIKKNLNKILKLNMKKILIKLEIIK